MTNLSGLLGSVKHLNSREFTANTTFTVPTGVTRMRIECIGGGGSGAIYRGDNRISGGGGGGGYSMGVYSVTPGNTLTITAGPGGLAPSDGGSVGTGNNGASGGTSSVTGMDSGTCSATGGAGGVHGADISGITGAAGGSGSGGSVTYSGGRGGQATANTNYTQVATGGGAPGTEFGTGGRGGDVSNSQNGNKSTGGGAIAVGNGVDIDDSTTQSAGGSANVSGSVTSVLGTEAALPNLDFLYGYTRGLYSIAPAFNMLDPELLFDLVPIGNFFEETVRISKFRGGIGSSLVNNSVTQFNVRTYMAGFGAGAGGLIYTGASSTGICVSGEFGGGGGVVVTNGSGSVSLGNIQTILDNLNRDLVGIGAGAGGYIKEASISSAVGARNGGNGWVRLTWESPDVLI